MPFLTIMGFSILLIVLCHIKGKSKVFPILLFGLVALNVVCCSEAADFVALEFRYDNWYFIEDFPIGFQWIFGLSKNLGLSFAGFKLVFAVCVLFFLKRLYNKYSIYPAICCALVFIYPCDSFYGQIRNGISAIIVIFAIMHYFDDIDNKMKKKLKFIIYIAIATIIHPSSIIYIAVLLVNKRIPPKKLIVITVVFSGVLTGLFYTGCISKIACIIIKDPRVLQWLKVGMFGNIFGSLFASFGHIAWIIYLSYVKRLAIPKDDDLSVTGTLIKKDVIEKIYSLNLISIVLIPMYFVTHNYFRIFKYLLFIDVLVAVQALYTRRKGEKELLAIMNIGMWTMGYLLSAQVSVGYRAIPNFYNSFDWSSLGNLFK